MSLPVEAISIKSVISFPYLQFDDYDPVDKIILDKNHSIKGAKLEVKKALPRDATEMPGMRGGRGGAGGGRGKFRANGFALW